VPLALSDCIEACLYLSGNDDNYIDIGLPFSTNFDAIWSGLCTSVRYNMSSNMCELNSNRNCSGFGGNRTAGIVRNEDETYYNCIIV
jgi:hypothetical protein